MWGGGRWLSDGDHKRTQGGEAGREMDVLGRGDEGSMPGKADGSPGGLWRKQGKKGGAERGNEKAGSSRQMRRAGGGEEEGEADTQRPHRQ